MKDKHKHCIALFIALLICGSAVAATQTVEGESWSGAKYLLAVPDNWNGDLAVYAHGYVDRGAPLVIPTEQDKAGELRNMLLDSGYAVACSSYSENGFAVQEGTVDTLALNYYFKKQFGKPERTFLVGHSLGGLVCVRLAECLPRHYDGVLTVAGMIGGSKLEIDYVANVRILFELNYPGVLPGAIDYVPPGLDLMNDVVYPIIGAISANPTNAIAISMIDQTPVPWVTGDELVGSFAYTLGFYYRGHTDLLLPPARPRSSTTRGLSTQADSCRRNCWTGLTLLSLVSPTPVRGINISTGTTNRPADCVSRCLEFTIAVIPWYRFSISRLMLIR